MADEQELDEHGLVIQKYEAMVLLVVPESDFGEQTLRYARSNLFNVHVGTHSVSTKDDGLIEGNLQDEFQVDELLGHDTVLEDYVGVIFAGGPGATKLAGNADAQRLAREAAASGKLLGAWGEAVGVLAQAGVLKGRKVTGHPDLAKEIQRAGGKYTGLQVQTDRTLVTARDESAGMRFGQALVRVVAIL